MACLQQLVATVACSRMKESSFCYYCPNNAGLQGSVAAIKAHVHPTWTLNFHDACGDGIYSWRYIKSSKKRCRSATSDEEAYLTDLQVPEAWLSPEAAAQESEWLRGALHQWLDEEYCPEPSNEDISRRCAKVYYYCLLEKQVDVGDILMQIVRDLETFSFKQSFHGPFTSANAAIDLITKRIRGNATNLN